LAKLILKEVAKEHFWAPLVALVSIMYAANSKCLNAELAVYWGNIVRRRGMPREAVPMRIGWLPT